ncbi:MAG: hypothetical protein HY791_29505 [Deltaproteobacteria bacterium]|nr:hypothetical protein [Deltaproteobacteria bacterium]
MRRLLFLLFALHFGCDSGGALGDACKTPSSEDECESGLICTNITDRALCLELCTEQTECAASENCNGIEGSSKKSCQAKPR